MATSSIDQEFVISDAESAERLAVAMSNGHKLPTSDRMTDDNEEKALQSFLSQRTAALSA